MAKNDMSKTMNDFFGGFPINIQSMQDSFRTHAQLAERMSKVYLKAAEKSADISSKWTKSALAGMSKVSAVKEDPSEYAKSVTDFTSTSVELASEHMAAYGEVAKRAQAETVEVMQAAGKDMSAEASAAMQKATSDAALASRKATDEVTAAAKKAAAHSAK
ncbi:phasin family protein [Pararhodobacter sp. SW119]|uniref:phasin family protein n=1 Tax=Pararhodobacter sp. SW119 TaxID=2780075 RepID=UPI001FD77961|nr:phasin family protein [Pararhodobacter sp. SW119]